MRRVAAILSTATLGLALGSTAPTGTAYAATTDPASTELPVTALYQPRSLSDLGVIGNASLRATPEHYSPGRDLTIRVSGTLEIVSKNPVVCHSLELEVARGALRLAGRLMSPDRTPLDAGDSRTQDVDVSVDVPARQVPTSGAITVTLSLGCSPTVNGRWSFPGEKSLVATAQLRPASGTVVVAPSWVFPDAEGAAKPRITARTDGGTTTIRVKRGKKTVWTKKIAKSRINLAVPTSRLTRSGTYRVIISGSGQTLRTSFTVSKGWAPLMSEPAHWERCSTITWSYDDSKAPRGADKGMATDLDETFRTFELLTGLTFVKSKGGSADIAIGWDDLGGNADGWGGASGYAGVLSAGTLMLSNQSSWAYTPGGGVDGRGALLKHELGHVLGLGHVTDESQLMFPIHTRGLSPLTPQRGDIAGLRDLYQPASCG